ncbi:MAG: D-alanine--D-alanine ligase [Planctomycetota bacterium]|nr:D-alanine--D-alanine ligase [Planctomycetota bacterium]
MERKKIVVGVIMGGTSSEREISIKTGKAVASALNEAGYIVKEILLNEDSIEAVEKEKIDVAFIAMHGRFGEDGELARLLEERKIPYTGSGPEGAKIAMDKVLTKKSFESFGVPTAEYIVLDSSISGEEADWFIKRHLSGYPVVVKPAREGSSVGVSIVDMRSELNDALSTAFRFDNKVLVEKYISGRELTCGILDGRALPLIELRPSKRFFDYKAKYEDPGTLYIVNPRLEPRLYRLCQEIALCAHIAVGARDFSRVDMILQERKVFVLEVNTIPGLTERSLLPKAAAAIGVDYQTLCIRMLEMALRRKALCA